jgi:predicted acetyltransferase/8-oxo-dGTP pyrophosphatase MutT (NUDIX family)
MPKEKSCGAIIYKYRGSRLLFLIAKMNRGHFSLVKGHVEDGESEVMTAYREIKEETNLDVVIDRRFRETIAYAPHKDRPSIIKDVIFFVATPVGGRIKKQDREVDRLSWLGYKKAFDALTYHQDKDVLKKAYQYIRKFGEKKESDEDLLRLALPSGSILPSYIASADVRDRGDGFVNPFAENVLQRIADVRHGRNLPYQWVSGTYLWLVIKNEYIGEISIRHELTPALLRFGGNIGYRIRRDKRKMGYGVKMLGLTLSYIKEVLGYQQVLITCDDDNIGSIKVIERNGGILQDKICNLIDSKETVTRRYLVPVL